MQIFWGTGEKTKKNKMIALSYIISNKTKDVRTKQGYSSVVKVKVGWIPRVLLCKVVTWCVINQ